MKVRLADGYMDGGRDRLGAAFLIKSSVDVFRVPINFFLHRREATEQKPILKRCYSAVGRPDVNKIACIGASIGPGPYRSATAVVTALVISSSRSGARDSMWLRSIEP